MTVIFLAGALAGLIFSYLAFHLVQFLKRLPIAGKMDRVRRAVASQSARTAAMVLKLGGMLVLGVFLGAAFSQGARLREPASSLLKATDTLERRLTVAIDNSRPVAAALLAIRADIDRIERSPSTPPTAAENLRLVQSLDRLEADLWRQNQSNGQALLALRAGVRTQRDALETSVTDHGAWPDRMFAAARDFSTWTGPTLFFTLLLVLLVLLLLTNPGVREFIGRSGTLSIWGLTLTLQDIGALRSNVNAWVKRLDRDIRKIYDKNLADTDIRDAFHEVKGGLGEIFKSLGVDLGTIRHRANLFVPGFAGDELIQATGYLGAKMDLDQEGIGRRFSARYGMVGKCWRLRKPLYNPAVNNTNDALVRDWGLTQTEADQQGGAPDKSLLGLPIVDKADADPVGVIYLEGTGTGVLRAKDLAKSPMFVAAPADAGKYARDEDYAELIMKEALKLPAMASLVRELKALQSKLEWDKKAIEEPGR